jgi:hypothetical protein
MALGTPQAGQRGLTTSRVLCHSPKVAQSPRVGSRGCPVPCADPADAAEPARQVPHSSAAEASCVHRSCTERAAQWHDVPEAPGRSTGTRRNHHCTLAGPGHGPCAMTSMRRPGGQNSKLAFFKFKEAARRLHIGRCMACKFPESPPRAAFVDATPARRPARWHAQCDSTKRGTRTPASSSSCCVRRRASLRVICFGRKRHAHSGACEVTSGDGHNGPWEAKLPVDPGLRATRHGQGPFNAERVSP